MRWGSDVAFSRRPDTHRRGGKGGRPRTARHRGRLARTPDCGRRRRFIVCVYAQPRRSSDFRRAHPSAAAKPVSESTVHGECPFGELSLIFSASPFEVEATREFAPPFLLLLLLLFHPSPSCCCCSMETCFCSATFHRSQRTILCISTSRHSWAAERARALSVLFPTHRQAGRELVGGKPRKNNRGPGP